MTNKQPKALQIIQGWEAIHDLETSEIEQLAWESCTELQRLHTANEELRDTLRVSLKVIEKLLQGQEKKESLLARVCCI